MINIEQFFPEILRDNKEYQVLIKLAGHFLDRAENEISKFTDLVDVDNCPAKFLPYLGKLLGYEYRYDIDDDYNREIIKLLFRIYSMRGTEDSLKLAATYFDNDGYIGGDVFLPNTYEDKELARIYQPREHLFKHTRSTYSGPHKRADNALFQEGVIELVVDNFQQEIVQAVEKVKPAGLRVKFRLEIIPTTDNEESIVGGIDSEIEHELYIGIEKYIPHRFCEPSKGYSRSARSTNLTLSGRQVLIGDRLVDISYQVDARRRLLVNSPIGSYYDVLDEYIDSPIDLQMPNLVLHPTRGNTSYSSSFTSSGSRCRSGLSGLDVTMVDYVRKPLFATPLYTISDLANCTLGESRLDYQDSIKQKESEVEPIPKVKVGYGALKNTLLNDLRKEKAKDIATTLVVSDTGIYRKPTDDYIRQSDPNYGALSNNIYDSHKDTPISTITSGTIARSSNVVSECEVVIYRDED